MQRLLLLFIGLTCHLACLAEPALSISGNQNSCPGATERYYFNCDDSNAQTFTMSVDNNGVIIEYGDNLSGTSTKGVSKQSVTISVDGARTGVTAYAVIKWGNVRGNTAKVTFGVSDPRIFQPGIYGTDVSVQIGSPDITGITAYTASCDNTQSVFSFPAVPGATAYNWQNTLGWSLVPNSVGVIGGYVYATFDNNGSTAASGQVTVSALNGNCPSTNSTRTFAVTRNVGSYSGNHTVSGPDVVPPGQFADYSAPDGGSYNWFVPSGWRIVSGQGTNHIQVQSATNDHTQNPLGANYTDVCGQGQVGSKIVSTDQYDNSAVSTSTDEGKATTKGDDPVQQVAPALSIYPNPAVDELIVSGVSTAVIVYNQVGAVVRKIEVPANVTTNSINTLSLANGLYNVQVLKADKVLLSRQIVIKH